MKMEDSEELTQQKKSRRIKNTITYLAEYDINFNKNRNLPVIKLLPSMFTMLAICAGLTSIKCSVAHMWEHAMILIMVAAFIDGMDGRLARMLNATSTFGAHLDSLSDFLNFGVAPAVLVYYWKLDSIIPNNKLSWAIVLLYTICSAVRLARFNTDNIGIGENAENSDMDSGFFKGVPMPVAGILLLLPIMIEIQTYEILLFKISIQWIPIYVVIVSLLMASRIRTFSVKHLSISHENIYLVLLSLGICMLGFVIDTWFTLSLLSILYIMSIPISAIYYYYCTYIKTS